jgi:hypothetical protein
LRLDIDARLLLLANSPLTLGLSAYLQRGVVKGHKAIRD